MGHTKKIILKKVNESEEQDSITKNYKALQDFLIFRLANTVYNRMGLLLKSLLCVSRALPAYKLSRRQGNLISTPINNINKKLMSISKCLRGHSNNT